MVNLLESREHSVAVIDNLSTGKLENLAGKLPQTAFYLQDVRNPEIEKIFDIERPELVVHFAAQASVIDSVLDPAYDADVNLMGLLNLLRCSMQYGVRKFVFISTWRRHLRRCGRDPHAGNLCAGSALSICVDQAYVGELSENL